MFYLVKISKVASPVGLVAGLISDVIMPLKAIAAPIFFFSLGVFVFSVMMWHYKDKKEVWTNVMSYSFVTTVVFCLTWIVSMQFPEKGAIATTFPSLEKIQNAIKNIDNDVHNVAQVSKSIKKDTEDLKEMVSRGYDGLISNPSSPEDYAANVMNSIQRPYQFLEDQFVKYVKVSPNGVKEYISGMVVHKYMEEKDASYKEAHDYVRAILKKHGVNQKYISQWEPSRERSIASYGSDNKRKETICNSIRANTCSVDNSTNCKISIYVTGCD
jgi:hypothetical protein